MSELFLFDYDGVIADSLEITISAAEVAATSLALPFSVEPESIAEMENVTFDNIGRLGGIPEERIAAFTDQMFAEAAAQACNAELFAGMSDALMRLSEKGTVYIISANSVLAIRERLAAASLLDTVTDIYGGDIPGTKADKILRVLAEEQAETAWMIGDSVSDVRAGKLAGVKTAATLWGWQSRTRLTEEAPDLLCETPETLCNALLGLPSK